ncbi:MAG: hypothetical protein FJ126_09465 [Deltaproteobacteria bacterium]|nr:hypothetical protein [Deltaproteobacteria bacterium]
MNKIQKEISQLWDEAFAELSEKSDEIAWDRNFLKLLNKSEKEAKKEAVKNLEPWISILNEGIQWLAQLHVALSLARTGDFEKDKAILVPFALVGSACAHSVAIRRLILSGLDASAKMLLRTLIETLNVCIAVIDDIELANNFMAAQDFEIAKKFWNQELSSKKLDGILAKIEKKINLEEEVVRDLKAWRKETLSLCSQYVHPSYVASLFAAEPPSVLSPYHHTPGIFGKTSITSLRTLPEVCKAIWYFSRIGIDVLMKFAKKQGEGAPVWQVFQGDNGRAFIVGREIYSKIMLRYWDHETPDIFEEDKLS